jgi:hypothetical protein
MPINSRAKGAVGEREICQVVKELFGWQAERTQQHCGNAGDSDVRIAELPAAFVEVKRVQKLNVTQAMEKATEQCQGKLPLLMHRRNHGPWLLTINLSQLQELVKMVSACTQTEQSDPPSPSGVT